MKFQALILALATVLGCSSPPDSTTGGAGGATATETASGGAGNMTSTTPLADLPETWSDGEKCANVAAIGPMLPNEAGAWALVCMPVADGLVRSLRIYPAVGGQCVPLATNMMLFSTTGDPPAETPASARVVPIPLPKIPAGEDYVRQVVDLGEEPYAAAAGMLCIGIRLAVEGEQSVCYVQGLNCGTSWLSTTESPYAWTVQNHIPIVGVNAK